MENERRNLSLYDGSVGVGGLYNEVKIIDNSKIDGDIDCSIFKGVDNSTIKGNVISNKTHLSDGSKIWGDIKTKQLHIRDNSSIDGNIETLEFSISDTSNVKGNIFSKTVKMNDNSKVNGDINAEDTIVKDSSTIDGSIFSKKIHLYDGCKVNGSIKGEEIKINDNIKIKKDCECENFTGYDCFQIDGLLNAEEINIILDDDCSVKEIGGNNISVSIPKNSKSISILGILHITSGGTGYLTANTIEGNTIYLENTTAKVVRGNKITIGDNCKIDKIEYKENINIDDNSTVNEKSKID